LNLSSTKIRGHGINLEQYYCEMAHQIEEQDRPKAEWPTYSDVTDVVGKIGIANNNVNINQFSANASNLGVAVTGGLNLQQQDFSFRFPLKLMQEQTSNNGCLVTSKFLLQRDIDIVQCKGSLPSLDLAKQCGVDKGAITDLGKQAIRYNANKKIDPKKQELRESLKDKLQEKLGGDDTQTGTDANPDENAGEKSEKKSTRDLLKDLLRN